MKRPAFQFYPADWRNNAKLRRCSWAARGAWVDVLGLLHDSDEYGVLRWSLREIAQAVGCPLALLSELARNGVLKGTDKGECEAFTFTPRHGGRDLPTVVLIPAQAGPLWFSSRFVRDEYVRQKRGGETRFEATPKAIPNGPPIPPIGDGPIPPAGDGSTVCGFRTSVSKPEVATYGGSGEPVDKSKPRGERKTNGEHREPGQWWRDNDGIEAKAREVGVQALPGEGHAALKDRVFAVIAKQHRGQGGTQ